MKREATDDGVKQAGPQNSTPPGECSTRYGCTHCCLSLFALPAPQRMRALVEGKSRVKRRRQINLPAAGGNLSDRRMNQSQALEMSKVQGRHCGAG